MTIAYGPHERVALDARARKILAECPDVGSFIRRGLGGNSSGEAIVYLRTALDPAPVVTSADAFGGLLGSASRWLRRNGVGPRDVVSLLAPNCTATSVVYWAAMSSAAVQPLNLLFTREAIAAQVGAVGAKILFTPPPGRPGRPVREGRGAAGAGASPRAHRRAAARWNHRLRRRGDRARRRRERTAGRRRTRRRPRSRRRAAADRRDDRARPRWFRSPTATSSLRRSPRCSQAIFAPTIA